jgi:OmpA-OmpF porin, OOP family
MKHIISTTILIISILFSLNILAQTSSAPIEVFVSNFKNIPLEGEQIIFMNQTTKKTYTGVSNAKGIFNLELPGGATYDIKIKSVGQTSEYSSFEIPKIDANQMYSKSEVQIMIEPPKSFTLNNVLFDTGKSTIKSSSFSELNDLVAMMNLKPTLKIEIAGHTDNIGNKENNQILSEERAIAVQKYLIQKGIEKSRVLAKGYGDTQPVADNSLETGRKQNRRTEVRILN